MGLTSSNLALIRYIQENQGATLEKCANKFSKNQTSVRREVEMINLYSHNPIIDIKKSKCTTPLSYKEYMNFIASLSFSEFVSTSNERVRAILVNIFFKKIINTSKIYEDWNLSLTTKKSDIKQLRTLLEKRKCSLVFIRKKGLSIEGDPLHLRFLVIQILYPLFDITPDVALLARIANNPLEKQMIELFSEHCSSHLVSANNTIERFIKNYGLSITNPSRKIFLCFLCLQEAFPIPKEPFIFSKLDLPKLNLYITDNKFENELLNVLLMNLDLKPTLDFPYDEKLSHTIHLFVDEILRYLPTDIHAYQELTSEVYKFFYKHIGRNQFQFTLVDRLVKTTGEQFPILYQLIEKFAYIFEENYALHINDDIKSALTFIFEKATIRNRIITNHGKKVVVVSNTSYERIDYFIENIKERIEINYVDSLYLNDLYLLDSLDYDYVFCFSERIFDILKLKKIKVILLDFFVDQNNIETLYLYGFERIKTKFLTKNFVNEISTIHPDELEFYLKTNYPNYFI